MIELDNLKAAIKANHDATAAANDKIDSLLALLGSVQNQLTALTISGGASASELQDLTTQISKTTEDIDAESAKVDAALMPMASEPAVDPVAQGAAAVAAAEATVGAEDGSAAVGTGG